MENSTQQLKVRWYSGWTMRPHEGIVVTWSANGKYATIRITKCSGDQMKIGQFRRVYYEFLSVID
jgi:hypothetical protein